MSHLNPGLLSAYNSLTDKHLTGYFNNTRIRRHLQRVGLITRSGRIVPDKEYRNKLIQRVHQRHVRECLAQAIFHKVLDMERVHQIEIKRKLEEFARRERVHKIKVDRSKRYEEDVIHILSPRPPTGPRGSHAQHSGPEGEHSESSESPGSSRPNTAPGKMQRPVRLKPIHSNSTTASHRRNSPYRRHDSSNDTDQHFNFTMEKESRRHLTMNEFSRGISPYRLPVINNFVTPVPPPTKRKDRGVKGTPNGTLRGRRLRPTTAPSGPDITEDAPLLRASVQSNVCVSMVFFGKTVHLSHDFMDLRDEVKVFQQHCGGENLCVYKGKLTEGETFQFVSRRHRGFPFSLTFFLNGLQVERLSSCCEFKHRKGSRLGGRHGHFGFSSVEGASPCYKCIIAMGLDKKPTPPPKRVKEDSGTDATSPQDTVKEVEEVEEEEEEEEEETGTDTRSQAEPEPPQPQDMETEIKEDMPPGEDKPKDDYEEDFEAEDEGQVEDVAEEADKKTPPPFRETEPEPEDTKKDDHSDSDDDDKNEDRRSRSASSSSGSDGEDSEAEAEPKDDQPADQPKEPEEQIADQPEEEEEEVVPQADQEETTTTAAAAVAAAEKDKQSTEDTTTAADSNSPTPPQTTTMTEDSGTQDSPGDSAGKTEPEMSDTSGLSEKEGTGEDDTAGGMEGKKDSDAKPEDESIQEEEPERAKSVQEKVAEAILKEAQCSSEPELSDTSTEEEEESTDKAKQQDSAGAAPEKAVTFTLQRQNRLEFKCEESAVSPQEVTSQSVVEEQEEVSTELKKEEDEVTPESDQKTEESGAKKEKEEDAKLNMDTDDKEEEEEKEETEGTEEADTTLSPETEDKKVDDEAIELQMDEPVTVTDAEATKKEEEEEEKITVETDTQPSETEQEIKETKSTKEDESSVEKLVNKTESETVTVDGGPEGAESEEAELKAAEPEALSHEDTSVIDTERQGQEEDTVGGTETEVTVDHSSSSSERSGDTTVCAEKKADRAEKGEPDELINGDKHKADTEEVIKEGEPQTEIAREQNGDEENTVDGTITDKVEDEVNITGEDSIKDEEKTEENVENRGGTEEDKIEDGDTDTERGELKEGGGKEDGGEQTREDKDDEKDSEGKGGEETVKDGEDNTGQGSEGGETAEGKVVEGEKDDEEVRRADRFEGEEKAQEAENIEIDAEDNANEEGKVDDGEKVGEGKVDDGEKVGEGKVDDGEKVREGKVDDGEKVGEGKVDNGEKVGEDKADCENDEDEKSRKAEEKAEEKEKMCQDKEEKITESESGEKAEDTDKDEDAGDTSECKDEIEKGAATEDKPQEAEIKEDVLESEENEEKYRQDEEKDITDNGGSSTTAGDGTEARDETIISRDERETKYSEIDAENGEMETACEAQGETQREEATSQETNNKHDMNEEGNTDQKDTEPETKTDDLDKMEAREDAKDLEETTDKLEDTKVDETADSDTVDRESKNDEADIHVKSHQGDPEPVNTGVDSKEEATAEKDDLQEAERVRESEELEKESEESQEQSEGNSPEAKDSISDASEDKDSDTSINNLVVKDNVREIIVVSSASQAQGSEPRAMELEDTELEPDMTTKERTRRRETDNDNNGVDTEEPKRGEESTEEASKPSEEGASVVLKPQSETPQLTDKVVDLQNECSASGKEANVLEEDVATVSHAVTPETLEKEDNRDLVTNWVNLHQASKYFETFVEPLDDLKGSSDNAASESTSDAKAIESTHMTEQSRPESPNGTTDQKADNDINVENEDTELKRDEDDVNTENANVELKKEDPILKDENESDNNTKVEAIQSDLRSINSRDEPSETGPTKDMLEMKEETEVADFKTATETEHSSREDMARLVEEGQSSSEEPRGMTGTPEDDKDKDTTSQGETDKPDISKPDIESIADSNHSAVSVRPENTSGNPAGTEETKDMSGSDEQQTTVEEITNLQKLSKTEDESQEPSEESPEHHSKSELNGMTSRESQGADTKDTKEPIEHESTEVTELTYLTATSKSENGSQEDSQNVQLNSKQLDGSKSGGNRELQMLGDIHTLSKEQLSTFSVEESTLFTRTSYPLLTTAKTDNSY